MKIDLKQITASGISIERTIPATGSPGAGAVEGHGMPHLVSDAALHISVKRTGERFHLRGRLEAEAEVECGRCLVPFSFAVRPKFDYYLVPRRQVDLWAEVEIDDTAKREVEVDSLELDLLHLAQEQLRLGLPMKPLCSENCQGLCLSCGADLNREPCGCREDEHDHSGLDVLSGLLERMKDDTSVS